MDPMPGENSSTAGSPPAVPPDFSLMLGGPLYQ